MSNLAQSGTFAGNDAIVAFARSQQVKVVIHQLNAPLWEVGIKLQDEAIKWHHMSAYYFNRGTPIHLYFTSSLVVSLWQINGVEKQACRELHIAYRYGDHYDSVRRVGDNSESPAQLRIEVVVLFYKEFLVAFIRQ